MSERFYVVERVPGVFIVARSTKHGKVLARFAGREQARQRAKKLKRDYLSPAFDCNGNPLSPQERVILGLWYPKLYKQALARGHARDRQVNRAMAVTA